MPRVAFSAAAVVLVSLSITLAAAGGHAAPKPGLARAVERTGQAGSERYTIHVRMTRGGEPVSLHIRGQASRHTISVKMHMGSVKLPDGTTLPGPNGAALLDGPFLYERAPSLLAVAGGVHWLRLAVPTLAPSSEDLSAVNSMTPAPILRVLDAARIAPAAEGSRTFHGTIAYDDPAVRTGLAKLTGGLEFRGLRLSAVVGSDGLVHRVVLTGRTADGRTTLSLRAYLYGFGRPVHVTPPAPGSFVDDQVQLAS
jgi:hypothetical protein